MTTMFGESFALSLILSKNDEFMQANQDLESTDRSVFDAAQLTIQRIMHAAIASLTLECGDCDLRAPAQFCEVHQSMFHETEIMLTDECDDEDKPVFRGVS